MNESNEPKENRAVSRENGVHAFEVGRILEAAADAAVSDSSKAGMIANRVVDGGSVIGMRSDFLLIWDDRPFQGWVPREAIEDLTNVFYAWHTELAHGGSSRPVGYVLRR